MTQGILPKELGRFHGEGQGVKDAPAKPVVAPGVAATHPYGVQYQGPWETESDGTNRAVRLHARALASTGIPVLLESFSHVVINRQGFPEAAREGGIEPSVIDEVGRFRFTSVATILPRIKHLVAHSAEHIRQAVLPRELRTPHPQADPKQVLELRERVYESTIVYTVWERDRVDRSIARQLARCAQAWVPCGQNAEMLVQCGVPSSQVRVVPHPFDPESDVAKLTRRPPLRGRRFYSIGKWEPRKGYAELILAFLRAFRPRDDVHLTIKHIGDSWDGYPSRKQAIEGALRDAEVVANGWTWQTLDGKLELISKRLPAADITRLHLENNIYVAPSHGEAWCLPAYDAVVSGNQLVHVPYGGTQEFAPPGSIRVPYRLGPVHPSYRWDEGSRWAEYDVRDLQSALAAATPPDCYRREPHWEKKFSLAGVGHLMALEVLAVAKSHPPARVYLLECAAEGPT